MDARTVKALVERAERRVAESAFNDKDKELVRDMALVLVHLNAECSVLADRCLRLEHRVSTLDGAGEEEA